MGTPCASRNLVLLICLFGACSALLACSPSEWGTHSETSYDTLVLRLEVDRQAVPVGKTVHAWFTIRNTGLQPVVINGLSKPVMDLDVSLLGYSDSLAAWSKLNPALARNELEWKPGETKMIELAWTATEAQAHQNIGIAGLLSKDGRIQQMATVDLPVFWDRNQ